MEDEEIWAEIPGFPDYLVSNHGRFRSGRSGKPRRLNPTQQGDLMIGIRYGGKTWARMCKRVVASVFVEGQDEENDTPMLLDGDKYNLHYTNMVWRPRWFSISYARQIHNPHPAFYEGPISDRFGNEYATVLDAAKALGALPRDVLMSAYNGNRVPPGGEVFHFV